MSDNTAASSYFRDMHGQRQSQGGQPSPHFQHLETKGGPAERRSIADASRYDSIGRSKEAEHDHGQEEDAIMAEQEDDECLEAEQTKAVEEGKDEERMMVSAHGDDGEI